MATINPSNLYNSNDAIFDAKPYIWHYDQLKAHEDAKDSALNDFYRNLPNTINDKGLRDIDVPGVNEARNHISQTFMTNSKQILKGNTPERYNYEKEIRDLQGKVQDGLNATQIDLKVAAAKLDPNKAYMFQGDDNMNKIASHNLSVFDPLRKGLDINNFSAAPKTWGDAEEKARTDYMNGIKFRGFSSPTYEPVPNQPTKQYVTQHPKLEDDQVDGIKLKSLYDYSNNIPYRNQVNKMITDPVQKVMLDNQYQHYTGKTPTTPAEYAAAFDFGKLHTSVDTRTVMSNQDAIWQRNNNAKIASDQTREGYKLQNISANKIAGIPNTQGYLSDEVADAAGQPETVTLGGNKSQRRVIYTDKVDPERLDMITGRDRAKGKAGVAAIPIKQSDGSVRMGYYQDPGTGDWTGNNGQLISRDRVRDNYINKQSNTKYKGQAGVVGKETKAAPIQSATPTKAPTKKLWQ